MAARFETLMRPTPDPITNVLLMVCGEFDTVKILCSPAPPDFLERNPVFPKYKLP